MLVTGSGHVPEVIVTDPGMMWILSRSRSHSVVGARDVEKLFGVGPRAFPELARQAGEATLVLHVMKELGRPVGVGGHDHLLGGVRVVVEVPCALRPAGVTRVHLEPASLERHQVEHLMHVVNLRAELLGKVEVVRRQLVLRVVAAAVVAVAAGDAAGAARPDPAEIRIVGLDSRRAEVDGEWGLVVGLPSADVVRDLLDRPVDVRGHVRVADDAEHPRGLVEVRRQLVGPIGDAGPFLRVEELLRWDVHRARIHMRAAADACAGEDEHVVEVLDPLDSVELRGGEPDEVREVPLGLRDVLVCPAPAGFHDADPVALLGGTKSGDASAEPRADDHHVVVEARHQLSFLVVAAAGEGRGLGDVSRQ